MNDNQKTCLKFAGASAAVGSAALIATSPAAADPVSELSSGVGSIQTMVNTATPIAVGVIVFAAAALVIKRLMYA